jgi:hypothetical protein
MQAHLTAIAALALALALAGCASRPAPAPLYPRPDAPPIELTDGPLHLGDDRATSQHFPAGPALGARYCALVSVPFSVSAFVRVRDVRGSETLANVLTVNGKAYPLPVTFERDPMGMTSNAMAASPMQQVRLEQGPSEICLVAGQKPCGDLDDFEVSGVDVFVDGLDPRDVAVRKNLVLGTPAPWPRPGVPWGQRQAWPATPPSSPRASVGEVLAPWLGGGSRLAGGR